jgi:exoribonuclease R
VTQRLLKAATNGAHPAYTDDELTAIAAHCTEREDAANKVERLMRKAAAALLLSSRIGERFDGIVTGAGPKGTWARVFHPPVEGKIVHGFDGLDIGERVHLKLIAVNVDAGFIDFVRTH